jgi:hypothetical protein
MPKKKPEYRSERDHSSFLTTLKPYLSTKDFEVLLEKRLGEDYNVTLVKENDANALIRVRNFFKIIN